MSPLSREQRSHFHRNGVRGRQGDGGQTSSAGADNCIQRRSVRSRAEESHDPFPISLARPVYLVNRIVVSVLYISSISPFPNSWLSKIAGRAQDMRRDVRILLVGDGALSRALTLPKCSLRAPTVHADNRGGGEEHDYYLADQGVLCAACMSRAAPHNGSRGSLLQVQHIVPEVTIPPEVTPENVTTYIVDSGGRFLAFRS